MGSSRDGYILLKYVGSFNFQKFLFSRGSRKQNGRGKACPLCPPDLSFSILCYDGRWGMGHHNRTSLLLRAVASRAGVGVKGGGMRTEGLGARGRGWGGSKVSIACRCDSYL